MQCTGAVTREARAMPAIRRSLWRGESGREVHCRILSCRLMVSVTDTTAGFPPTLSRLAPHVNASNVLTERERKSGFPKTFAIRFVVRRVWNIHGANSPAVQLVPSCFKLRTNSAVIPAPPVRAVLSDSIHPRESLWIVRFWIIDRGPIACLECKRHRIQIGPTKNPPRVTDCLSTKSGVRLESKMDALAVMFLMGCNHHISNLGPAAVHARSRFL